MIRRMKQLAARLALQTGLAPWGRQRRTSAPLPHTLAALRDHLHANGVRTSDEVLQEPSWGGTRYRAGFLIGDTDRLLFVAWCDRPETSHLVAERLTTSKTASLPLVNGTLVAFFNERWPANDPLTRRVRDAFSSFRADR